MNLSSLFRRRPTQRPVVKKSKSSQPATAVSTGRKAVAASCEGATAKPLAAVGVAHAKVSTVGVYRGYQRPKTEAKPQVEKAPEVKEAPPEVRESSSSSEGLGITVHSDGTTESKNGVITSRSDGTYGVDIGGGMTMNSNGTISQDLGNGIRIEPDGKPSFDLGSGMRLNSNGSVGVQIGGFIINTDGTSSYQF